MKVREVNYSDVLKFYSEMFQRGYSFNYIKSFHKILQPAFQLAVDDNMIRVNPCYDVLQQFSSKIVKSVREPLTKEQQSRLMRFVKENYENSQNYVILATFLGTGLRIGELIGLTWDEVDLENGVINLKHQVVYGVVNGKSVFYSKKPKYNSVRQIPLQANLLRILKQYYEETWELSENSDILVGNLKGFLFWSSKGSLFSHQVLRQHFYRIKNAYNKQERQVAKEEERFPVLVQNFTPHVLRHTYCTRMAEAGMNVKVLQFIMGHKDVTVTMDIYNHITKERIMSQLPKIEQLEL